jgi:hypothetical protein
MGLQQAVDSVANMFSGNNHKYSAISDPEISHDERATAEQRASARRFLKYAMVGVGATILLMFTMSWEYVTSHPAICSYHVNLLTHMTEVTIHCDARGLLIVLIRRPIYGASIRLYSLSHRRSAQTFRKGVR